MKVKELKQMVAECVTKAVKEAGYDQYGESTMEPTDPGWFDTLAAPDDEPEGELKSTPTARKLVDMMKHELKKFGKSISRDDLVTLATDFELIHNLPDGIGWDIAHAAMEELKGEMLAEKKSPMKVEAFVAMVRGMIREEFSRLKKSGA